MVKITEQLVRKRSEHNEGLISTLEEITLHQEDIEKLEHLQNWSKDLKILYLHSNLIPKIENIHKLKKLEYLNMTLNNVERIENLERCESLEKLDMTLNFVGELTSVDSLKANRNLRILYLTGNPCTDYPGYREYVIATLPQLTVLDGVDITRSERIQAMQVYDTVRETILQEQEKYRATRSEQKESSKWKLEEENTDHEDEFEEEKLQKFWSETCDNSPETRVQLARHTRKNKGRTAEKPPTPPRPPRLFTSDGRPLNMNHARVPFTFNEEPHQLVVDIAVYRYLDTALLDVDIQPNYVRVLIKQKVFQFVLPVEVKPDSSTAQRSQTTGHLVITMPTLKGVVKPQMKNAPCKPSTAKQDDSSKSNNARREFLEIGPSDDMDFSKIVSRRQESLKPRKKRDETNWEDNPEVPPLE